MESTSEDRIGHEPEQAVSPQEAGDLIVNYLDMLGVKYVFGIPGGAIEPLFNALARSERRGGPRVVVARHESGAAFMADGYARETGKLGVCCATTGPGATNMITGVASAYQDNIPLLVITAQTLLSTFGKGALQESSCTAINTIGMFQYCTRYNSLVSHIDQLENKLTTAIMTASRLPSGPVHLSIPLDIMNTAVTSYKPSYDLETLIFRPSFIDEPAINDLVKLLSESNRIVFVLGNGCSEGIGTILQFALQINASVVATPHGKGYVSSYHPQFYGIFGFAGHQSAARLLSDPSTDLVIAVGTGLGEWDSNGWDTTTVLNKNLVHIDSNTENFVRSPMARLHVTGRISSIFKTLLARVGNGKLHTSAKANNLNNKNDTKIKYINIERRLVDRRQGTIPSEENAVVDSRLFEKRKSDRRRKKIKNYGTARNFNLLEENKYNDESTPIKPQRLMHDLARLFPPNTRFLADNGNSLVWAMHYLHPLDRRVAGERSGSGGVFRSGIGFASMGWAIGGAIGTALGSPSPVVCITGDGSMLMCGQEITVALAEKLPVIVVLLNDSELGMVKHGQAIGGGEPIAYTLPRVNFCSFARSMGIDAYEIHSPYDMALLDIKAICNNKGPTLLDVYIDPREVPPMDLRLKILRRY